MVSSKLEQTISNIQGITEKERLIILEVFKMIYFYDDIEEFKDRAFQSLYWISYLFSLDTENGSKESVTDSIHLLNVIHSSLRKIQEIEASPLT
jgi:hypothetical protein